MKIINFKTKLNKGFGILENNQILTTKGLMSVQNFSNLLIELDKIQSAEEVDKIYITLDTITYLPPVLPVNNIFCVGKNYYDHIVEFDGSDADVNNVKENPVFFTKAKTSLTSHLSSIESHPNVTKQLDYEAELAVVIKKTCKNISRDEAKDYIHSYVILNDITARDLQKQHQQWFKGKSLDTFCPIGPYLVTADEINNPQDLNITLKVNEEIRQQANTSLMIHDIYSLIEQFSKGLTLQAGDIIATGTPSGVGVGMNPPTYLSKGDVIEITIDQLGSLVNNIK